MAGSGGEKPSRRVVQASHYGRKTKEETKGRDTAQGGEEEGVS